MSDERKMQAIVRAAERLEQTARDYRRLAEATQRETASVSFIDLVDSIGQLSEDGLRLTRRLIDDMVSSLDTEQQVERTGLSPLG